MKLSEALEKNRGKSIRVGMQKGNAFVFCGWADEKAFEVLAPYLDREVKQVFKNYLGGLNILIEGKESGKFWTSIERIGTDTDKTPTHRPIEAYQDVVNAVYKTAARALYDALVDLAPADELYEKDRTAYQKALEDFDKNQNINKVKKLSIDLSVKKERMLESRIKVSQFEVEIKSNEDFLRSGRYCISPDLGEHIILKVRQNAEEEIAERKRLKALQEGSGL